MPNIQEKKQIKDIEECYIEEISFQEFEMNLQIHLQVDFFNSTVIKVHHFVYYSSLYIFKQCQINIEELDSKISYLELPLSFTAVYLSFLNEQQVHIEKYVIVLITKLENRGFLTLSHICKSFTEPFC